MNEVEVLDPTSAEPLRTRSKLAPRLAHLDGKVIGALWNGKPQDDIVLKAVLKSLEVTYGLKGTRFWKKPVWAIPTPATTIDEIARECDAVITGVAT